MVKVKPFILPPKQVEEIIEKHPKSFQLFCEWIKEVITNGTFIQFPDEKALRTFCMKALESSPRVVYDFFSNEDVYNPEFWGDNQGSVILPRSQSDEEELITNLFIRLEKKLA
jgi:hypothetical protein